MSGIQMYCMPVLLKFAVKDPITVSVLAVNGLVLVYLLHSFSAISISVTKISI
jgi:hypothetical protein